MLQKQKRGFARADREVLLDLFAFLAAKRRIGDDDVEAVFLLNVGEVLGERVGVNDVRGFDAVQDHVHDRDDIGRRFLFLAVKRGGLQCVKVFGCEMGFMGRRGIMTFIIPINPITPIDHVIEGFTQEAG